jgi:hypothetical protein
MKPISEKKLAANRANALKSTGPRTARGKAISSRNSAKHGLNARSVLLRCEDREEFRRFVNEFHREYLPQTATEASLVNTMATARWRQARMCHFESAAIDLEYVSQTEPAVVPADFDTADRAGLAYLEATRKSRALDLIGRSEARLQRQFDSSLACLLKIRKLRAAAENGAPHKGTE